MSESKQHRLLSIAGAVAGSVVIVCGSCVAALARYISKAHQLRLGCASTLAAVLFSAAVTAYCHRGMLSIPVVRSEAIGDSAGLSGRLLFAFVLIGFALAVVSGIAGVIFDSPKNLFLLVNNVFELIFMSGSMAFALHMRRVLQHVSADLGLSHPDARTDTDTAVQPPKSAKFLLLLIPRRDREYLVGDLEEEYRSIVLPEYGEGAARFWYWCQVCLSLGPLIWARLKRIAGFVLLFKSVR